MSTNGYDWFSMIDLEIDKPFPETYQNTWFFTIDTFKWYILFSIN